MLNMPKSASGRSCSITLRQLDGVAKLVLGLRTVNLSVSQPVQRML